MNPLHARTHYRLKSIENWGIVLIASVPLLAIACHFLGAFLGSTIVIALLFYIHFFLLEDRVIGLNCSKCDKYIASNTPWICGFCGEKNKRVESFPFLNKCEHCGAEPKAYICHHAPCPETIYLTHDKLKVGAARCATVVVDNQSDVESRENEAKKKKLEFETAMNDLKLKFNASEERLQSKKKKSVAEEKDELVNAQFQEIMGVRESTRKLKKMAEEAYKDDPEGLRDAMDAIELINRMNA